jgi:hypothetical protein
VKKTDHPQCRPPRNALAFDLKRLAATGKFTKDNGSPSSAFVGKDPKDETASIVWVTACKCVGAECPRFKAMAYAGQHYDTATVQERPVIPGKSVRSTK